MSETNGAKSWYHGVITDTTSARIGPIPIEESGGPQEEKLCAIAQRRTTEPLLRIVSAICAEISDGWETNSYRYMSTINEL